MANDQVARDYARIEQAITYLHARRAEQPALAEVAAHVGMSSSHFERMFARWAGVSPGQFLRFLTAEYAKLRLRAGASVLDAAYEAGLSGPGRLHDLLVTCEAVTPGEYKRRGEGVRIVHGIADSPFGACLVASTERGLCGLQFAHAHGPAEMLAELRAEWPGAEFEERPDEAVRLARRIFDPLSRNPIRLHLRGTNFQLKVWQALLRVPPGELVTYEDLAKAIGQQSASRAVGSAVGANPVSCLVPCHRVIRKTGVFGNYRWGSARKLALCGWEAARASAGRA